MSTYSEMPCWEIMQCNRKQVCLFADSEKKACWEQVKENDAYSFHTCVDCLVYMVKHVDSPLTELEISFILEHRKNTFTRAGARNLSYPCIGSTPKVKGSFKRPAGPPL